MNAGGLLALNGNFIALAKDVLANELANTRIALWHGDKKLPEVTLPGHMGQSVTGIILEAPYVILSLFAEIGRKSKRGVTTR